MKNNHQKYWLAVAGIAVIGFSSLAWTGNHQTRPYQSTQDTVPNRQKSTKAPSKEFKKDFDKELNELDKAMKDVKNMPDIDFGKMQADIDASMKKVAEEMGKHKIDMEKMQKELNESLGKIDMEKMNADIKASLKELEKIDMSKMQKDLKESLAKIDNDELQANLKASLKELDKVDREKMRKDIERSMENVKVQINSDEIRKQVEDALSKVDMEKIKVDMEKMKEEMQKNKGNMKLDMDQMRKDLDKTKKELEGYQEMVYIMEEDGLLKTSGDYKIEFKEGELFINGTKQPTQVTSRYKKYFSKDGITIKKEKGELNINIQ